MMRLSAIICSHNPRPEYLRRTLEGLCGQSLSTDMWEFVLVDNGSSDVLSESYDLSWHPNGMHVREEVLGLTAARVRGISESNGEVIVFIDDDNVLDRDYLKRVVLIADSFSHLGVFGAGVLEPEFEKDPSPEILPFLPKLALRSETRVMWTNNPRDGDCCPFGAGLCVHRGVAVRFVSILKKLSVQVVLGRRGKQLNSNEDDVFAWAAAEAGLGFGVFPELKIVHLISAARLTRCYILRLLEDSRFSECVLYYLLEGVRPRRLGFRVIARVIMRGSLTLFGIKCRYASARGEIRAARFIDENDLRVVDAKS